MSNTQVMIQRQDPNIEAYRLGLLRDVQGFTRNQIFGQNVQALRAQGLSDDQIAQRLSVPGQGTEGQDPVILPRSNYSADRMLAACRRTRLLGRRAIRLRNSAPPSKPLSPRPNRALGATRRS
jgi:hypothetical protein